MSPPQEVCSEHLLEAPYGFIVQALTSIVMI